MTAKTKFTKRLLSIVLSACMLLSYFPAAGLLTLADSGTGGITTVADPATLTRPETIYGDNTVNAGKITVGKSVSDTDITVNGQKISIDGENNFLVTISQSAQVMGLTSQTSVPVDVVFVLDTSGSMDDNDRSETMVTAANSTIATLMAANPHNRVAVVAFSSEDYGNGTSNGAAANVLSSLAHYTDDAATNHLRWVNSQGGTTGNNRNYIAGRDTVYLNYNQKVDAYRHGKNGGTNIQAGIIAGAKILTSVTNPVFTDPETNESVTRIPFLIILSDGQPTFSFDDATWYDPTLTGKNAAQEQGPGDDAYEGNGFIAALTAAYYKGLITEHYYGSKASNENHCYIYTMGVELDTLSGDEAALARITLDPKSQTTGEYADANASSYWNYGNTANNQNKNSAYGWKTYWNNYLAQPAAQYDIRVDNNESYTITEDSITDSQKYVSGIGYTGGIAYNDQYFSASSVSQMESVFKDMLRTIQQKSMTVPTKVTSGDHDFDGYVTFTDPIGEYMEVKDMKGILAGGYFYQGASFAQKLANYGTANADSEFDDLILKVIKSRMNLTSSTVDIDSFITQMKASVNQAYYHGPNDYDNSIVWWGNAYNSGEEDEQVQVLGFADNDTIEYIEAQKQANTIPEGADYVCRSYFFYGEAGGANPNPDHEYLYFMVRVQRELEAPYRETVVISAPASLLSMEKVLIEETFDKNGNSVYTATVEHQEPARVVYEVGLWDTITAENVSSIVSNEYASEKVNGQGSVNYDPETDTYNFFTNDWDRSQSLDSHHRGLAKATFDAAADNSFYTYQEDTLIVDANGNAVTSNPTGKTVYYVREYYEWPADGNQDGTYDAVKKTKLIEIVIPADANLVQKDGNWYLPKGAYTAATLVVNGDDTVKSSNNTGTASVVAHPHRTGDSSNSHYTVILGNNGMLSLAAETYEPVKTVSVNLSETANTIVNDEGKPVKPGDILTYTVEVKNVLTETADITVTDYVPLGTSFVEGSAGSGTDAVGHTKDASITPNDNNILTWTLENVPAGEVRYVSFQVTVTEAALSLNVIPGTIENTAKVQIGNSPAVSTNTTHNSPYGKTVTDVNNQNIDGQHGYKVGDTLVYHIRFHNNARNAEGAFAAADVTVTDQIPAGTTFLSADNGGTYDEKTGVVTWNIADMAADSAMTVSFRVIINAGAKIQPEGVQPETGEIYLPNTAVITINNDPQIVFTTNTTENWADVGDMVITKTVAAGGDQTKTFTLQLTESTGMLSGTYPMNRDAAAEAVVFTQGKATVTVKHGQTLTIKGLPAGAILTVQEDVSELPGWTPAYNTQSVTIVKGAATTVSSVSITNTYTVEPLTLTLKGQKNMSGNLLSQATFGFVAEPDSANPVAGDPLTGEVTVDKAGEYAFAFSPKVFTAPGVYKYTISEINGSVQGISYDSTKYILVINVIDNGDGTMRAEATLDGSAFDMNSDAVAFSNSYTPEETQLELTADKELTGRQLTAGEFNFLLTDGTNTYKGINDAQGNILFETITYTAPGTYTYTVSELVPDSKAQGVAYDTKTYKVVVTVTDENGQLVTAVTVDDKAIAVSGNTADTGIIFQNSFEPDDVPLTLVAKKTLKTYQSGSYVSTNPEAGAFLFQIVEKETSNVVATGTNTADGTVTFNTFYFTDEMLDGVAAVNGTKTKTFTYVISEVVPEIVKDPNMLYDLDGREVQVTLTYTANGKLTVSVGGDSDGTVDLTGSVNFVNYDNPDSVEIRPAGTKTTKNAPAGVSFSFSVINTDSGNEAAAGVGDANGDITFSTMSFSEPGTYTYWIKESNAGNTTNGITYDNTRYLMKVVVSRNSYNRLVAEVSYWSSGIDGSQNVSDYTVPAAAPSFHNEYNAGGYINLTAKKRLTGRNLTAGEFAFKLIRQDNGGEIDGIVAADGTVSFSTMYYSEDDIPDGQTSAVIHYVMSEVVPTTAALPGVSYDTASYDVYVRITDNGDGTITAELVKPEGDSYTVISGTDTGVTFVNSYTPVQGDRVTFQIGKTLNGRDLRAGEFEFQLQVEGSAEKDIATNDAGGIVTFSREIPATATPGTYEMVIREVSGSMAGVSYDTASYKLYLKITDDGKGSIVAQLLDETGKVLSENSSGVVDLTDSIRFVNTYEAHDTSYTPEATKSLTGRAMVAGEFSFQAQLISKNGTAVNNGTVYQGVNNENGDVIFTAISYTDAGTYIYRISEVAGNHSGIRYDSTAYYLKVTVTDDGYGHLKASAGYYSDEACTQSATAVSFSNTYTPADVIVQLEATKELTGRALQDKEFSFVVRQNDVKGAIVATGSNDASGKILFSTFEITAQDMAGAQSKTFTYVVMESDNKIPGVTVDSTVFTVKVTVTDDGTGVLSAVISYPDDQPIVFENTYKPAPAELPLVAYKTLNGKNLKPGEFTFELKDAEGKVIQSVTNDGSGTVALNNLKFEEAGTYVYTLSEKAEDAEGIAYDTTVYTVTVTVTDDGKGNLHISAAYTGPEGEVTLLSFVNSFTPVAIEAELEGTKAIVDANGDPLTGENYSLAGFEFEVYDTAGKLVTTAVSDENGNIKFTGFTFTEAGEYRFLISEKTTDRAGYSTDPTVWCVHLTIGYNADTGELFEANEYVHLAPEVHEEILAQSSEALNFVNVYDPADVSLTLKVKKELTGRPLRDHEFTFVMVDKATGLFAAQSSNHADGDVNFVLSYSEPGEYAYTVYELIPEEKAGGISYATERYSVTVTVTDDGSGALKAQVGGVTVLGSGTVDLSGSVVFRNTYEAEPVDVTVEAVKNLEGKLLEEGMFTFRLENTEDSAESYLASNTADGKVIFEPISFTEAGEFTYTLSEIKGSEKGVTYDENVYTVTVTVTDAGNGKLHAVTHYTGSDGSTEAVAVFHNFYKGAPAEYTPEVKKIFEGDQMRTFDFVLTGEGFETQTKQNNDLGEVTFDKLVFENAGSYTFTVEEKADPSMDDIRWDTNVYTLVIEVADDGKGQLQIMEISIISDTGRNDLVFRNVHEDIITHKDVFLNQDISVSIDGKTVGKGDILTYTISYKNYTGLPADITITDTIPQYTTYVEGSADHSGSFENGVITWNLTGVAPEETVTVSFSVKVTDARTVIENQGNVLEGTNTYETNIVTNPVEENDIYKDVFDVSEPTVSINGETVQKDDVLLYTITFTNSKDFPADVTVTDVIPQYTAYVEGSADNGGVYADGKLTWNLSLAAGESKTVSFQVKVTDTNITVVNQATALEGENSYETNMVSNPVPQDTVEKDVFYTSAPTVSIDGKTVQKGEILLYAITYTNSFEAAADVTVTDVIPQYTTYVEGSADNGGVYADGKLTWTLSLEAGESKTVTFQVKVAATDVNVVNQATALEGENELKTNIVTNPVPEPTPEPDTPKTGDDAKVYLWFVLMLGSAAMMPVLIFGRKKKTEEQ